MRVPRTRFAQRYRSLTERLYVYLYVRRKIGVDVVPHALRGTVMRDLIAWYRARCSAATDIGIVAPRKARNALYARYGVTLGDRERLQKCEVLFVDSADEYSRAQLDALPTARTATILFFNSPERAFRAHKAKLSQVPLKWA